MAEKQEKVDKLMQKGFDAINNGQYDEAIKAGNELKRLHHSSAFEILALAYDGKSNKKKAISVLEEGVRKAPLWILWQLLGNIYSDIGEFDKAYFAYNQGLQCQKTNASSIHLNYAIALERENKLEEALNHLEMTEDEGDYGFKLALNSTKARIYNAISDYNKALEITSGCIRLFESSPDNWESVNNTDEFLSNLYTEHAYAVWMKDKSKEQSLISVRKALLHNRVNSKAQWLLREMRNEYSDSVKYFTILISGEWPSEDNSDELNFMTRYEVVAESVEEALRFIKDFEPEETWSSLKVVEYTDQAVQKSLPKGVYAAIGHCLYPRGNE